MVMGLITNEIARDRIVRKRSEKLQNLACYYTGESKQPKVTVSR